MKFWDVCAVEALIRGRFGIVTDKDKQSIIYQPNADGDYTIPNGLIIASTQSVYDLCYSRAGNYLKNLKVEGGR